MHINLHSSIVRVWSELPRAADINPEPVIKNYSAPPKVTKDLVWTLNEEAVTAFATTVRIEVCAKNKRGNIYQVGIEDGVRGLLPSFFEALRVAGGDGGGVRYVHDWIKNALRDKIGYELALREGKNTGGK